MIFFKPYFDEENPNEASFEAFENEALCGKCKMLYENGNAVITSICFDSDKPYLVEGLIKAAFNFAANDNYYMGYCKCDNITRFLDKMNFQKADGIYFNDIPSILTGNCCKCPDNI